MILERQKRPEMKSPNLGKLFIYMSVVRIYINRALEVYLNTIYPDFGVNKRVCFHTVWFIHVQSDTWYVCGVSLVVRVVHGAWRDVPPQQDQCLVPGQPA